MNEQWVADLKLSEGSWETSVCYGKPGISWGWFGRDKIRIEGSRTPEDGKAMADQIAAALNAAGYDPNETIAAPIATCLHGYTVCAMCKFPAT